MTLPVTSELIARLRRQKRSVPQADGLRLLGFVIPNEKWDHLDGVFMLDELLDLAERGLRSLKADAKQDDVL